MRRSYASSAARDSPRDSSRSRTATRKWVSRSHERPSARCCSRARPPSVGRSARECVSRETRGDGRARGQGRDARARRRRHLQCHGRCSVGGVCQRRAGTAAPSSGCMWRRRSPSHSWSGSSRALASMRWAIRPTRTCRWDRFSSQRRAQHVSELVNEALAQGARLRCGGPMEPPPGCSGAFYAPTVLTDSQPRKMRLMREPLDGPVLAVMAVDSIEQAIALANNSEYGLGASVWSADRHRGTRIARELHAGMVWLQRPSAPRPTSSRGPWGAAAGGGLGKTLRRAGSARVRAGEADRLVSRPDCGGLWWGPYDEMHPARSPGGGASCALAATSDRERAWRQGRSGARAGGRADAGAGRAQVGVAASDRHMCRSAGLHMCSPVTSRMRLVNHWRMRQWRGRACTSPGRAACGPASHESYPVTMPAQAYAGKECVCQLRQRYLRPELRAGHARHPLLHRLPAA